MRKKSFIVGLLVVILLGLAYQASAAYTVSYFYVQNRVYEDGRNLNRIWIEFKDEAGTFPTQDGLESVILTDPLGNTVTIADLSYRSDGELDGEYDGKSGRWTYGEHYQAIGYSGRIDQSLVVGDYQLTAVFQGVESTATYRFFGKANLPIIPSSKIKAKFDKAGNLTCEWQVPYGLWISQPDLQTSTRAMIDVYDGSTYVGSLIARVPTHMGRLLVPQQVLSSITALGNFNYKIGIQLRTNDNNNRTYSKFRTLKLPKVRK